MITWAISLGLCCGPWSGSAAGDGGAVRLKQTSGPFVVTVFTPEPMQAGPVDVSILVQEAHGSAAVLDALVSLHLSPKVATNAAAQKVSVAATHSQATNKLLYAASVDLPVPGLWTLQVEVHRGVDHVSVDGALVVAAAPPALRTILPYLLVPPVAILVFALHQWLAHGHHGQQNSI